MYTEVMMPPEEVLRNIEYVRCPACMGARVVPIVFGFLSAPYGYGRCTRCVGWGYVVDPPEFEERMKLGLAAIWGSAALQLLTRPRKRLRLPLRKQRKRVP